MSALGNPHRPQRIKARDQVIVGMWVSRRSDRSVYQVRNVYRHEKRVQLAPDFADSGPFTITRAELQRDYEAVGG